MPLTNSQYDAIMRDYYTIQSKNKSTSAKRRDEIISLSPEYAKVTEEIGDLSVQTAIARITEAPEEARNRGQHRDYKSMLRALREKQKEILTSLGKPADYLDPIYTCPKCKDTGYIGTAKCSCFKKREIELLYRASNLKNMAEGCSFEDFRLDLYSEAETDKKTGKTARALAENALNTAKSFVDNFDKIKDNIFIFGNTGLGKTFLSTCIATELINTIHSVIYITATELFNKLNTFDEDVESSPLLDCDLLIIDDLGTEYLSEVSASKLFYCINERLLRGKSCVISTNLDLKSVRDHYSERLFSRIVSSYKVIKLYGHDIRTSKLLN